MLGRTYAEYVTPFIQHAPRVEMSTSDVADITEFATRMAEAKKDETCHVFDSYASVSRKVTGFLGELALDKLFGTSYMDRTITPGNSAIHHHPDLRKFGCGIKTVNWVDRVKVWDFDKEKFVFQSRFPLIQHRECWPEIINFRQDNTIIVCGLATVSALNTFQDSDLLENKQASDRKTGFWGFHQLKPFRNLPELNRALA